MTVVPLRIGGELRETGEEHVVRSPFDGTPVGSVAAADASHVEAAIHAAAQAAPSMRRTPAWKRADVLERSATALTAERSAFAERIAREAGKPIAFALGEVDRAVITFRLAAGEARQLGGEVMPADLEPRGEGRLCLYRRVPRGPIAAIAPFNFPLNLIAHKVAPAIAAGAPVVLKPPPQCPLTGFRLAELIDRCWAESGDPIAGALNVIHTSPENAQRLVEDDRMKVVSFTGSDAVGWRLKALAGKKQVLLELGGNAPCIVDEDADIDQALAAVTTASFAYAGQVCIKVQRLLIHAAHYDDFLARLVENAKGIVCGDPMREDTVVGPVIDASHADRILSWIDAAREAGAAVHCGGTRSGQIIHPTVLSDVPDDQRVCRDEVFGPVVVVEPFHDFEQALQRCNETRYGLQAGIFTRDIAKAMRAFEELDYGGVMINDTPMFRVDNTPYGGTKDSGFGREGVKFAVQEMTEPKLLVMRG